MLVTTDVWSRFVNDTGTKSQPTVIFTTEAKSMMKEQTAWIKHNEQFKSGYDFDFLTNGRDILPGSGFIKSVGKNEITFVFMCYLCIFKYFSRSFSYQQFFSIKYGKIEEWRQTPMPTCCPPCRHSKRSYCPAYPSAIAARIFTSCSTIFCWKGVERQAKIHLCACRNTTVTLCCMSAVAGTRIAEPRRTPTAKPCWPMPPTQTT